MSGVSVAAELQQDWVAWSLVAAGCREVRATLSGKWRPAQLVCLVKYGCL